MPSQADRLKSKLKEYFFISNNSGAICLFCFKSNNNLNKGRMKKHFEAYHINKTTNLKEDQKNILRNSLIVEYEQVYGQQQSSISIQKTRQRKLASYHVAYRIAKNSKPFSDGKFVREC